jgi:hypothetical protein
MKINRNIYTMETGSYFCLGINDWFKIKDTPRRVSTLKTLQLLTLQTDFTLPGKKQALCEPVQ